MNSTIKFELPPLPYAYDALEPSIDKLTKSDILSSKRGLNAIATEENYVFFGGFLKRSLHFSLSSQK